MTDSFYLGTHQFVAEVTFADYPVANQRFDFKVVIGCKIKSISSEAIEAQTFVIPSPTLKVPLNPIVVEPSCSVNPIMQVR